MTSTFKDGKCLTTSRNSNDNCGSNEFTDTLLKLVLELLSFVSIHSTKQGAGASQWRNILDTIRSLSGNDKGNEALLMTIVQQLPWKMTWDGDTSQFIPTCVLALTLTEADILGAILDSGHIHDVGRSQLQVKMKHDRDELVLNVPPGAVHLSGVAAESNGFAGCLAYLTIVTQQPTEPPANPDKDYLDINCYDNFVTSAAELE